MIKNLIPAFIFLLLIFACSKDSIAPDEQNKKEEKQLLSLTVNGFSQNLLPFIDRIQASNLSASLFSNAPLSSSTNLSDHINTLEFRVYKGRNLVDISLQYSDDPDFGKYENYFLPSIDAYLVFVTGAMLDSEGDIEFERGAQITRSTIRILPEPVDAFFFTNTYIIGAETQTEHIQLKRFVGRLEIDLTEEITNNAQYIEITVHNTAQYFMPFSEDGYNIVPEGDDPIDFNTHKTFLIKPEDIGRSDYSVDMYFILNSKLGSEPETSKVTIRAVDKADKEIAVREIHDVILQANKRTKLTGRIFTSYPNRNFDIELDGEWDENISEFGF